MLNWELYKRDGDTGIELWKTPTKFLVCQRYLIRFKFRNTLQEAMELYREVTRGGKEL